MWSTDVMGVGLVNQQSFYTCGSVYIDLLELKKEDLSVSQVRYLSCYAGQ